MSMGHQINTLNELVEDVGSSPLSDISIISNGSSSTLSSVDESEIITTKELAEQYLKFEEALYLEASPKDLPRSLQDEVKIWTEHTPHIRIRGIKVKLNEKSEVEGSTEDIIDPNFEEVIAFHNCNEKILSINDAKHNCSSEFGEKVLINKSKKTVIDNSFNEKSSILEYQIEPVIKSISAGKIKPYKNVFESTKTYLEIIKPQKPLSRSYSSRSYLRDLSPRKSNVDFQSECYCPLSSKRIGVCDDDFVNEPLSERELHRISRTSLPKARTKVLTFSAKLTDKSHPRRSKATSSVSKNRNKTGITVSLPPIEALAIAPKKPDKRANSAMVRFTKTLPRVRPVTSKKKNGLNINYQEIKNVNRDPSEEFNNITLEIIGTQTSTARRRK